MKIGEVYIEKKTKKKKILVSFDYNKLTVENIKKIKGGLYLYNSKVWVFPYNDLILNSLRRVGFNILLDINTYPIEIRQIYIENNYIIIVTADEISKYIIQKEFTFFDQSTCFSYGKFDIRKAKKVELFKNNAEILYIPVGFLQELNQFIIKRGVVFDFNYLFDNRKKRKWKFTIDPNILEYITLRDYQIECLENILKNTMGIIKLLPGTGKTEIFLALCKLTNIKTLILTNSIDLTRQTYERGIKADLDVGIVQGENLNENHQVVMATVQSSHKLKNKYEMVIIDECHEIGINEHHNVLSNEDIVYRYGFSATPFGKDKFKNAVTRQFIGGIIYTVDPEKLQEKNILAVPNINIYNIDNMNLHILTNFRELEKLGIIHNDFRNNIIANICKSEKGQKLILVKKVVHGNILKEILESLGINSIFLYGGTPKKDREIALKEFDKGDNDFVLIGCKVLKQGVSIDHINHLILAGGGSSFYETIQMLGRGLRGRTKDTVEIYDFNDNMNKVLYGHSQQRIKDYKKEGFTNINYL